MTGVASDSFPSRAARWAVRNALFVVSGLALTVSSILGGVLFTNVIDKIDPGASLLTHKLASAMGGRYVVAFLALVLLLLSQWLRGKIIHLRQQEYDRTGDLVLHNLRANPTAKVPDFYLYLRAFETTGKLHVPLYLRLRRKCVWVYQRLVTDDLESYTSLSVRSIAPLIALGRPGESIGAGRILTDEERWKTDIVTLMRRSKGILLVPSDRPGTVWEMDTLKREGLFSKVVFVMPPRTTGEYDTAARWEAARKAMAVHGLEAPEHQERGMLFRLDCEGKLNTAEPLLLSSPRKIRKAFKRLFKDRRRRAIYKEIVRADKRASRAAFWGWLENTRQLSVFPVALLAVLLPTSDIGFDPSESWSTVFDRSMTAREISDYNQDLHLIDSKKYLTLLGSAPEEKQFQLKNLLVTAGLARIPSKNLVAYYGAQGQMLKRIHDKDCAAYASGQIQPATMQVLQTYIPSDRIHDFLEAETLAIRLAAEEAPVIRMETNAEALGQQFLNNLSQGDSRRYLELIQRPESLTPEDRCWMRRTQLTSVEKLPAEQAVLWARALAAPPENQENQSDDQQANQQANQSPPSPAPTPQSGEEKAEPQRAALLNQQTQVNSQAQAPSMAARYETPKTHAVIADSTPAPAPDPTVSMLANAHAAMNAGHLTEPITDCALAWALRAKQSGNAEGAAIESQILLIVGNQIVSETNSKNYDAAIDDVNKLMLFYPGREQLVSLKSKIESEQQRTAAEAQLKKFVLQHRHVLVANNGNLVQAYCVGILLLAPDGSGRFDCTNTVDPQGRCDHVAFAPGTIKQVKFLQNGLLHVATHHEGNFDFYGTPGDLQGAYQGLQTMAAR